MKLDNFALRVGVYACSVLAACGMWQHTRRRTHYNGHCHDRPHSSSIRITATRGK